VIEIVTRAEKRQRYRIQWHRVTVSLLPLFSSLLSFLLLPLYEPGFTGAYFFVKSILRVENAKCIQEESVLLKLTSKEKSAYAPVGVK
jgi:hypothetical protein